PTLRKRNPRARRRLQLSLPHAPPARSCLLAGTNAGRCGWATNRAAAQPDAGARIVLQRGPTRDCEETKMRMKLSRTTAADMAALLAADGGLIAARAAQPVLLAAAP